MMLQTQGDGPTAQPDRRLALLTGGLPGTGGRVRSIPEDFRVTEWPAYEPSGSGEHLYLRIEKTGIPTEAVVEALCGALAVPPDAVGYAGKKDADAVTQQWFSVHTERDWTLTPEPGARFRVIGVSRHGNKLRPGHLRGNHFQVTLRQPTAPGQVAPILDAIREQGLPNYFGPQRVGSANANALTGRALLHSGRVPSRRALERHRFALNAYQAALFNLLVHQRLTLHGTLGRILPGDLAVLHRNGAAFAVTEAECIASQARADDRDLSPSAPMFGYRVDLATGIPGEWEQELLTREGLTLESFRIGSKRVSPRGERRPVRVFPEALAWDTVPTADGPAIRLEFTLPPGSYATALLREVTKADALAPLVPPGSPTAPSHP